MSKRHLIDRTQLDLVSEGDRVQAQHLRGLVDRARTILGGVYSGAWNGSSLGPPTGECIRDRAVQAVRELSELLDMPLPDWFDGNA